MVSVPNIANALMRYFHNLSKYIVPFLFFCLDTIIDQLYDTMYPF